MNLLFPAMVRRWLKPVSCPDCGRATSRAECSFCAAEASPRAVKRGGDEAATDRDLSGRGSRSSGGAARSGWGGSRRAVSAAGPDERANAFGRRVIGIKCCQTRIRRRADRISAAQTRTSAPATRSWRLSGDASGSVLASYRRGVLARQRTRRERDWVSVLRDDVAAQRSGDANADITNRLAKRDRVEAAEDRHRAAEDRVEAAEDRSHGGG